MHQFRDSKNRTWELTINVAQVRRVRDLLKVDIAGLADDGLKPLAALFDDPCKLVDVLFALIQDAAKTANVTDLDFGSSFDGDVLESATQAFTEELINFFPQSRRMTLRKMMDKTRELMGAANDLAIKQIDAFKVEDLLPKSSEQSGDVPASLESTPALSPSGS